MTANVTYLAGLASAPWTIATMARAGAQGASRWSVAAVAAAVACGAFAGEFQGLAWSLLVGAALSAAAGRWRGLARAGAAAVIGLLVAGIQLVPSWVLLQRTTRAEALEGMESLQWPFEPWRIVEWLSPGFFGGRLNPADSAPFLLLGGPTARPTPFVQSVFIGAVVILLAIAGATAPSAQARTRKVLVGAAAIGLWLALGHRLGATQLTSSLPIWGAFRYPEKWLAPLVLCAAVLAALGAGRLAGEGVPRWLPRAAVGSLGVAAAAWLAVTLAPDAVERGFAWVGGTPSSQPMLRIPADAALRTRANLAAGLPLALLPLGALVTLLALSRRRRGPWLLPALAALVALEGAAAIPFASPLELSAPAERSLLQGLAGVPVARVIIPYEDANYLLPKVGPDEDALAVAARLGVAPMNVPARVDNLELYTALVPRRWNNLVVSLADDRWRAFRRYAATHVVVPRSVSPRDADLAASATEGGRMIALDAALGATVWSIPHRPWAFFPEAAVVLRTPYDVHDRLLAAIAVEDPTVFLEAQGPVVTGPGVVRSVLREPERVRIEAESPADALLVVSDAWLPGWRAKFDEKPVEILPADILLRAVRWPAGRHVLEMTYEPPEVLWGAIVSASGLALLLIAMLRYGAPAATVRADG
jgi:hypothetical protein